MRVLVFTSRSGSDGIWLSEKTCWVGGFVTNNSDSSVIEYAKSRNIKVFILPRNPQLSDYNLYIDEWGKEYTHCFLMGWMRIIPPEICNCLNMYNLHPGDIFVYPELRGKDPQEKALKLGLKNTGVVIHRVVPEVDSGEIILRRTLWIENNETLDSLTNKLVELGRKAWIEFVSNCWMKFVLDCFKNR